MGRFETWTLAGLAGLIGITAVAAAMGSHGEEGAVRPAAIVVASHPAAEAADPRTPQPPAGLDLDAVATGTAVPRTLSAAPVPAGAGDHDSADVRSTPFLQAMLPPVLMANEEVLADRRRLFDLIVRKQRGAEPSALDRVWLSVLADKYGENEGDLDRLLTHVDAVPPSLLLATAAIASNWGRSAAAGDKGALFERSRPHAATAESDEDASAQPSLLDAVRAYLLKVNAAPAYRMFRERRSEMRAHGKPLRGLDLVSAFAFGRSKKRGAATQLEATITTFGLDRFDAARLEAVAGRR